MTALGNIDVIPDHDMWPLWVSTGAAAPVNTDPAAVPLPSPLVTALREWASALPLAAGTGAGITGAEDDFWMRGRILAGRVAVAVAGHYRVRYFDGRHGTVRPVLTDAGVRADGGRVVLPGHWRDVSGTPEVRDALAAELSRELPPGHALEGRHDAVLARCDICDDVLLGMDREVYAVVHLTGRREIDANWPSVEVHTDAGALLADLSERHDGAAA